MKKSEIDNNLEIIQKKILDDILNVSETESLYKLSDKLKSTKMNSLYRYQSGNQSLTIRKILDISSELGLNFNITFTK